MIVLLATDCFSVFQFIYRSDKQVCSSIADLECLQYMNGSSSDTSILYQVSIACHSYPLLSFTADANLPSSDAYDYATLHTLVM